MSDCGSMRQLYREDSVRAGRQCMRVPFFLAKIKSLANQAEIICLIYSEGHIEMWTLNKSLPLVVFCDISNVFIFGEKSKQKDGLVSTMLPYKK